MTEDKLLDIFTDSIDMNLSKLQEIVENRGDWHTTVYELGRSPGGGNGNHSNILPGESHGQRNLVSYSPEG